MDQSEIWSRLEGQDDEFLSKKVIPLLDKEQILAAAAREDSPDGFAAFFELMQGYKLHREGVKWVSNIYEARELNKGLAQEAFRGSGKTTVFSKMFLAFRIGQNPEKSNIVIRINAGKARETVATVADIIDYDKNWMKVFPHVRPDKEKGWSNAGYFVRRTDIPYDEWMSIRTKGTQDPTFTGYGWGSGSVIGSRANGLIIVDDIHDRENTASDIQMQSVKDFITETLEYVRMPGCWEIWNFTPWRENDVYAYIKGTGEYLLSKSPVAFRDEENGELWPHDPQIPFSNQKWVLNWPEMFSFEELGRRYRRSGHIGFSRMMLLDLEATKGQLLKREWLGEYPSKDISPAWPVVFGVDYASTIDKLKSKDADFFAVSVLRVIPGGGVILVDGFRGHVSKAEAINHIASMAAMWPTLIGIGVETVGGGREFYQDLMALQDFAGRPLPLREIQHKRRSKGDRFENWLAPHFQMRRAWIADVFTPFMHEFVNEWLIYPAGQHDDTLDSVYMGLKVIENRLFGPRTISDDAKSSFWPYNSQSNSHPYAGLGRYKGA